MTSEAADASFGLKYVENSLFSQKGKEEIYSRREIRRTYERNMKGRVRKIKNSEFLSESNMKPYEAYHERH